MALNVWEDLKKQVLLGTARHPQAPTLPEVLPQGSGTPEQVALHGLGPLVFT